MLSADAYGAFEVAIEQQQQQPGGEDKLAAVGARFRNTVLGLGGSEHPMEVFKRFRGRLPSTDALLKQAGLL